MNRPHLTSKPIPTSGDHAGWANYWADYCLYYIGIMLSETPMSETAQTEVEYAIKRGARMCFWHCARLGDYRYWDPRWTGPLQQITK